MRFAVVDVETSGLSTRRHRVLQVSVVTAEVSAVGHPTDDDAVPNVEIIDEWESLVRLRWPFQRVGPRKVHGISRSDLRGAPHLEDVMTVLADKIGDAVLTAHNLDFDLEFLRRAGDEVGVDVAPPATLCTLKLSRSLDPRRQERHRLGDLADRFGLVNDRPHNALHDARTTALALPHLFAAAGAHSESAIAKLIEQQRGRQTAWRPNPG